ncbi:hypothetical protein ONZ45_g16467 [Pleurotus djamor]|nr:hypothetical protein ONZ45_g16467 [Pleurotus djamor]
MRPSEKRRRDDEDDDGLPGRLSKMKTQDQAKDAPSLASTGRTKPGDDPPKKIKLKFGLGSVAVVQSPSPSPNSPSPDTPSAPPEGGVRDEDPGYRLIQPCSRLYVTFVLYLIFNNQASSFKFYPVVFDIPTNNLLTIEAFRRHSHGKVITGSLANPPA